MSDFFKALKDDLTDRRLMPIVICVGVLLFAAVAYAALAGGGSSSTPAAAVAVTHTHGANGIAISQAESASGQALAETTDGSASQRHGAAHDPFAKLPSPAVKTATVAAASSGGSGTSSSSSGAGSSSSSEPSKASSEPASPSKPTHTEHKSKTTYKVALQFGKLLSGVSPQESELPAYAALSKPTPLPSKTSKLIEFLGVTGVGTADGGSGKSALFALEGEVILQGEGVCKPSPAQCSLISLKVGQSERLEYLSSNGELSSWELRVVSINTDISTVTSTSRAARAHASSLREERARAGLLQSAGLRWSSQPGVIVFAGNAAHAARHAHR